MFSVVTRIPGQLSKEIVGLFGAPELLNNRFVLLVVICALSAVSHGKTFAIVRFAYFSDGSMCLNIIC